MLILIYCYNNHIFGRCDTFRLIENAVFPNNKHYNVIENFIVCKCVCVCVCVCVKEREREIYFARNEELRRYSHL
jgi:hypothetical protein